MHEIAVVNAYINPSAPRQQCIEDPLSLSNTSEVVSRGLCPTIPDVLADILQP